jgi:uncharacterized protein involved in exopolysaccharide biosynthesis
MLVYQVLRQRLWIVAVAFVATLAGAGLLLLLISPRYDATASASIDPSVSDPVSGQSVSSQMMGMVQGNLIALAKSNQVALAVIKRLNMDADANTQAQYHKSRDSGVLDIQQWLANSMVNSVDAKFGLGSNVLSITYKGSSPQQAATLANTFMSAFIDAAIGLKGSNAQKAAAWYTPQIDTIRAELSEARTKLAQFQKDANLLAPSAADAENDQLMSATSDLLKAKAELVALQSQLATPAQTGAASIETQSVDIQSLVALRSNLSSIDAEIAKMQTDVGANNPRLREKYSVKQSLQKQLDAQIQDVRKKLNDRIASQIDKIATLEKLRSDKLNFMIGIQSQREQLSALTHDVSFHQEELERLQRAASQSRLQSQLSFSNIANLDEATPPTSVSFPKPLIIGILAVGVGLGFGILLALLAEALDRRVRTSQDLQYIVGAPLLGVMIDTRPKRPSLLSRLARRLASPFGTGPKRLVTKN